MTTPTSNAVPSEAPQDLLFNAGLIDTWANGTASTLTDRRGIARKTLAGHQADAAAALQALTAFNPRGAWASGAAYSQPARDVAVQGGIAYLCTISHTAGATFAADLAAGRWVIHQGATREELAAAAGALLVGHQVGAAASTVAAVLNALAPGRAAPHANFSWFAADFTVAACAGPGRAALAQDIGDVWLGKFGTASGNTSVFVRPTGNDSNAGGGWGAAYLTLAKALRQTDAGIIYVWPGEYDLSDFRYSDTGGARPKRVIAPFGGVTLRVAGDTISAATWAANGTYGNVWQTVLTTNNKPIRILDTSIADEFGDPVPLPQFATLADVNNTTMGWHYDSATKTLSVRYASENINTGAKSKLAAIYGDSGGSNRVMIYSANAYFENIMILGYVSVLKVAGQAVPQFWAKNCTWKYGATHGLLVEGGYAYTQDCSARRMTGDGANYNTLDATAPRGVEINFRTAYAGDIGTYGTGQTLNPVSPSTYNKNGSSAHSGTVVRVNGRHVKSWGPNIADTAGSYSWNLGVTVDENPAPPGSAPTVARYGILNQGNSSWLDGCSARGVDAGFNADSSAVVNIWNCAGTRSATSSGTFTDWVPA